MFDFTHKDDERGQVGIGTLIIFIAMVLVAAIAAGVLINTAGLLQSQASNTGSETQDAVANQIDVVHATGNVTPSENHVDRVNMTIKKSAGSNAIDINSMTVQYTSDRVDKTLIYRGSGTTYQDATEKTIATGSNAGVGDHNELDHAEAGDLNTVKDSEMGLYAADSNHFTTFAVNNGADHLTNTGERITLMFNTTVIEDPNNLEGGLNPGDSATIKLIDQSGAQFTYGVSVPSTFGDQTVVIV